MKISAHLQACPGPNARFCPCGAIFAPWWCGGRELCAMEPDEFDHALDATAACEVTAREQLDFGLRDGTFCKLFAGPPKGPSHELGHVGATAYRKDCQHSRVPRDGDFSLGAQTLSSVQYVGNADRFRKCLQKIFLLHVENLTLNLNERSQDVQARYI